MTRFTKRILLAAMAAASLLATSCGNSHYPLNPQALQARGLKPGEGYIVGTFHSKAINRDGQGRNVGAWTSVNVRGTGSNQNTYVGVVPIVMPVNRDPQIMGGGQESEVFAIPVPAGDYEVTGWRITGQAVTATVTVSNRKPLHVPFQVRAGEATYIGRSNALTITGKNILGMPVFGDGIVLMKDEFAQDQARLRKLYPSLRSAPIHRTNVPEVFMTEMKRVADSPRGWWE
jgi:hypothetical protein